MVLHLRRNIIMWSAILIFYLYLSYALQISTTTTESDEDNSSSEETVSDLIATPRQKRSAEVLDNTGDVGDDKTKMKGIQPRIGIPGLPDPATILKVAEILKTVGEQVIPILVEGMNDGTSAFAEHLGDSTQFLNRFKKDIEQFTQNRLEKAA